MKNLLIHPCPKLQGTLKIPGDKSISHRAVMFSSLADGKSTLKGLLQGEDVMATIACFQAMGVPIEVHTDRVEIEGVGLNGLKAPSGILNCGNSGTTMRLMMGILAGQPFTSRLTGDESLNRRPMERVAVPLRDMGAQIEELRASETERVIKITGRPLHGIEYRLPVASAQVKSAIILAGLYAQGKTRIHEPMPSRDHTEIMLIHKGASVFRQGEVLEVEAAHALKAEDLEIPGDISSAAFFLVGGSLGPGSRIRLEWVGVNPTRTGILDVLEAMGANLSLEEKTSTGGEKVAHIAVESATLHGTEIKGALIPRLIDEIPILSIAAGAAQGRTLISDAAELRVKETDRIAAVEEEMVKLSLNIKGLKDGLEIEGPAEFQGGAFDSRGDHRMAMSLAIAATQAQGPSTIENVACVDTSYPEFFTHLASLGPQLEIMT